MDIVEVDLHHSGESSGSERQINGRSEVRRRGDTKAREGSRRI